MKMRELFPSYYSLTKDDFNKLWLNCIFIFDTNILLNFYRYSEETCKDIFNNILVKIQDRLWIPHQVALEFQENRNKLIEDQKNQIDEIKNQWSNRINDFKGAIRNFYGINPEDLIKELDQCLLDYLEKHNQLIKKKTNNLEENDYVRDIIEKLFDGKIGNAPNQDQLNQIYKEGEDRYKIKYPPGYKDKDKKKGKTYLWNHLSFDRIYGDLILWKEIIEKVTLEIEQNNNQWKYIIFVTDDNKEDWWLQESGKTISPRRELIDEIYQAGAELFWMYNSENFVEDAKEYLQAKILEESERDVNNIAELISEKNSSMVSEREILQAFFNWLSSQYPNDKIFLEYKIQDKDILPNRTYWIDCIRLTQKNNLKIGYEVKSITKGMSVSSGINQICFYNKKFNLDKWYLLCASHDKYDLEETKTVFNNLIKSEKKFKHIGLILGFLENKDDEYHFILFDVVEPDR